MIAAWLVLGAVAVGAVLLADAADAPELGSFALIALLVVVACALIALQ